MFLRIVRIVRIVVSRTGVSRDEMNVLILIPIALNEATALGQRGNAGRGTPWVTWREHAAMTDPSDPKIHTFLGVDVGNTSGQGLGDTLHKP